ncbi:tetratricopeptide repeat protein [Bremerella sp. T1]|uniref:tetratricopeptide repeat protein n=1 Tax=Bremerella sp. TYQ1 TaxID=3119568 RepID=UPI001CCCC09F|nr:tetratricopeptide repeat protein [Bremerella volcania]UBM38699.1 tetratricopeptide repeat protein [Bremerella volcania]
MNRMQSSTTAKCRWQSASGGVLAALMLAVFSGCSTFSQANASHQQVVQARQLTQRGVQAMHRDDWENAEKFLAEAKKNAPYDLQARMHYAETLWKTGKPKEAIAELEAAMPLGSDDPNLHATLGRMYLDAGDPTKAHISANRAIECDPKFAPAWQLQGDLALVRRDLESAKLSYIRAATNGDSTNRDVQVRLASTYRQLGQPSQALACISLVRQVEFGHRLPADVGAEQALAYRDLGRHLEAADCLGELAEANEMSADMLYVWAECEVAAGRLARAEYAVNSALQRDPQHPSALKLVGQLPAFRQQAQQAMRR